MEFGFYAQRRVIGARFILYFILALRHDAFPLVYDHICSRRFHFQLTIQPMYSPLTRLTVLYRYILHFCLHFVAGMSGSSYLHVVSSIHNVQSCKMYFDATLYTLTSTAFWCKSKYVYILVYIGGLLKSCCIRNCLCIPGSVEE